MAKKGGPNKDQYRELFKKFDADGNGYLSISEFRNVLKAADSNLKDSQIAQFFLFFDGEKGDRRITEEEFSKGLDQVLSYVAKVKDLFKKYDSSGDGFLDRTELRKLLTDASGGKMTTSEMDQILKDADRNRDNQISLNEFLDACC
ncbi:hypothetical protein BaRGS_00008054 [Batillaria attramentaria]|uniref:EF-hand domain-containing protein n=1 Tax=Batillaria attramentaria TaxID=370345 RepID=A0ABD0LMR8_9CAEN|nr:hypothetical protein BaRGS_029251 [Batillaria attramentaria]